MRRADSCVPTCPIMFRRVIAGLFLGPALLLGSFAWSGYIALSTVFDGSRSATIAHELLDNEEVRSQLAANMGSAVEGALPQDAPVGDVSAEQISVIAEEILADPQVEALIVDAFTSTHRAFLGDGDAPRTLDLTPVATIVREHLVSAAPALESQLPAAQPLVMTLPTDQIPNAKPINDFLERVVPILAALSLAGLLVTLLTTSDRPSVLKRAAGWALGTTAVYLILGLGVPELLRRFAPAQAKVIAEFLTAVLRSTLRPSIILAVAGGVLLIAGFVWPERSDSEPAIAAAPVRSPVSPVMGAMTSPDLWPDARSAGGLAPTRPQSPKPKPRPLPPAPARQEPPRDEPQLVEVPIDQSPTPDWARPTSQTLLPPPVQARPAPSPVEPPAEPPSSGRQTLPTRADTPEPIDLPAWTGEPAIVKNSRPKWVEGHGWVLDPNDPRPPPSNARWVEGVGHVVPGPPPAG